MDVAHCGWGGYFHLSSDYWLSKKLPGLNDNAKEETQGPIVPFRIVCNHFQLVAVYFTFDLAWPAGSVAEILLAIFGFGFIDMFSLECNTGSMSYEDRWAMGACLPLLLMLPFATFTVLTPVTESMHS